VTRANPITVIIRPTDVTMLPVYQVKGGPEDDKTFPASSIVIFPNGEKIWINEPRAMSTIPEANTKLSFVLCFAQKIIPIIARQGTADHVTYIDKEWAKLLTQISCSVSIEIHNAMLSGAA
jgi:hypothetical protein